MPESLRTYLDDDPLLLTLWEAIRKVGPVRSISVDLTHRCNLRCTGCYYFEEGMDAFTSPADDTDFDAFIQLEMARGTNFVTIVGGEPSLEIDRIRKIYAHFRASVATNGLRKIPFEGLEELPIGVSIWGSPETDSRLRADGRRDLFETALRNYRNDPRAFWYYTVAPGHAHEVADVVQRCIDNGNRVLFNYYSDLSGVGGELDYRLGFEAVRRAIDDAIERHPGQILMTPYFNQVISTGDLLGEKWGYDVCTNLSVDYPGNAERLQNGKPYNPHFRAYNADFKHTRRCCTGVSRSCASCFDTWEHFSWIMISLRKHLRSKTDFHNWLTTAYLFYFINRLVDYDSGIQLLPDLQKGVVVV